MGPRDPRTHSVGVWAGPWDPRTQSFDAHCFLELRLSFTHVYIYIYMWYMLDIIGDSIHLFTILFIQQMTCRPTGRLGNSVFVLSIYFPLIFI